MKDRSFYPKIATLYYKEKNLLNLALPIRVKLINYPVHKCMNKDCTLSFYHYASTTEFIKYFHEYCSQEDYPELWKNLISSEKYKKKIPKAIFENEFLIKCPKCLQRLDSKEKKLVKIYTKTNHTYIKYDNILHHTIPTKSREVKTDEWFGKHNYVLYFDDVEKVYKALELARKYAKNNKRGKDIKLVIHKDRVTQEILERNNKKYWERRFAKSI